MLNFDRAAYAIELAAFRSASVASDGKADVVASTGMAALLLGELTPLALAITVFDAFGPKSAKGKACAPKEADNGTIAVRSLEQPGLKGSAGARVMLEALLYCFDHASDAPDAVNAFAMGDKFTYGERPVKGLSNLKALIKANRAAAAKAEAGTETVEADEAADTAIVEASLTDGERLAAALGILSQVTCASDASERLVLVAIAAEIDRISSVELALAA